MQKEKYKSAQLEVINIQAEDIIMTSHTEYEGINPYEGGGGGDEYETPKF